MVTRMVCFQRGYVTFMRFWIPAKTKQMPPKVNMVQWLRPRQSSSMMTYRQPPMNQRIRVFNIFSIFGFIFIDLLGNVVVISKMDVVFCRIAFYFDRFSIYIFCDGYAKGRG